MKTTDNTEMPGAISGNSCDYLFYHEHCLFRDFYKDRLDRIFNSIEIEIDSYEEYMALEETGYKSILKNYPDGTKVITSIWTIFPGERSYVQIDLSIPK